VDENLATACIDCGDRAYIVLGSGEGRVCSRCFVRRVAAHASESEPRTVTQPRASATTYRHLN